MPSRELPPFGQYKVGDKQHERGEGDAAVEDLADRAFLVVVFLGAVFGKQQEAFVADGE